MQKDSALSLNMKEILMNKILRSLLPALGLIFVFNIFAVTETKAQSVLQEILNRMDKQNKSLATLKANLTMVKINSQLEEKDEFLGTTMYIPKKGKDKMYARIDWIKPAAESVAIIGDEYTLFQPRNNKVIQGKTNSTKTTAKVGNSLEFMSMSKDQLKKNYTLKYLGEAKISGGISTWHLELTPKKAASYKTVEIWVDGNGMPLQSKVNERNNDSTTILISDLEKNITLNAQVFIIKYPKNIKPIKG